jgi:putative intracellular protease/amidase
MILSLAFRLIADDKCIQKNTGVSKCRAVPGQSGHDFLRRECLPLTQSGHRSVVSNANSAIAFVFPGQQATSEGVAGIINDRETIEFVRQQARAAKYVTSVCTGAFVLGAAGLLKGRRATTHWAYTDLLPLVGATYEKARVVKDGNVITGGGVTAGIDFGLSVIGEIAGETTAKRIQLGIEYDPAPPFDSGHPDKAPALTSDLMSARYNEFRAMYRTRIEQGVSA